MLRRSRVPRRWGRVPAWVFALVMVMAGAVFPLSAGAAKSVGASPVGPKRYYLALGDSVAYGYQPNLDLNHGYAEQWFANDLSNKGTQTLVNYACPTETSTTFITGGCRYHFMVHDFYIGSQLNAAVSFIKAHPGQVSPVTLDLGANDLLQDFDTANCTVDSTAWNRDVNAYSQNLTTILSALSDALASKQGRTGDLIVMNYYNPYQNQCFGSGLDTAYYTQQLNNLIAQRAAQYNVPVADVYTAFGSGPSNTHNWQLCVETWKCTWRDDIHPSGGQFLEPGNGYGIIAATFRATIGY